MFFPESGENVLNEVIMFPKSIDYSERCALKHKYLLS